MMISNRSGAVHPGSSGTIIPGFEARIVDDNNRTVAQGETGNLLVRADSVCACYWNQHERLKTRLKDIGSEPATSIARMKTDTSGTPDGPMTC